MPWWYYNKQELRNTPSIRDGMEYEVECQYRREGARFIIETGNKMDLGYNTMATGVVYFHRFYMVHSFKTFPRYLTACCALFLAGKVEETPKKAKDIIRWAEKTLPASEFSKFGEDPKEELLVLERILLQSIKFDLQVDHPYAFLLKYAKSLKSNSERPKMQDVLQMAWTFVNDSLCTTLCLQWEPEIIAVAMLYLAAKLSKFDISNWSGKTIHQTRWWEMFVNGVNLDLLEDICHQVLDLYSQKRANSANSQSSASSSTLSSHHSQSHPHLQTNSTPNNHNVRNNISQNPMPMPPVPHNAAEPPPSLPPPVIPSISNPIPNITAVGNLYPAVPNVAAPPPPPFSVPPPGIPMVPPPPHAPHDPNVGSMYPQSQYNTIPTHYSGSANQYGSYPTYGNNY